MISQTVEYALRAIVTIAQNHGKPCTAQRIAEITKVPGPYLSKLMQGLVRGGLVTSQRGPHGGFLLMQSPGELTIWDVVQVVEPLRRITECPLGLVSHSGDLCPLHRRLDRALETVEALFRSTTVAEMLADRDSPTPLCEERKTFLIDASRLGPTADPKKQSRPKSKKTSTKSNRKN